MNSPKDKNNKQDNIKIEEDYLNPSSSKHSKKQSVESYIIKNQMSAIEEEDRNFLNSNTEAMTISQLDNYLMQSIAQGEINNLTNINIAEQINNITDADLRKQLMRYNYDDLQNTQNANDLSYSNISQLQQSLSNIGFDAKDDYLPFNLLSDIKSGSSLKQDALQFKFDKSSKYFQKFLNGEDLNDSSIMQNSYMMDYPQSQKQQSKDISNFLSELNQNNQDNNTLRVQLSESTQRYKQTLVQNKILIEGYEILKQQIDDLTKQVNSQQENKKSQQKIQISEQQINSEEITKIHNSSSKQHSGNNKSSNINNDHLGKQQNNENVQKLLEEIHSLRQKNLELMSQKAELENNNQSQSFRIIELQSQLNAKDSILKEKNQEIKRLFLQNETFKIEMKHIESLNGLLTSPAQRTEKIPNTLMNKKNKKNGSFYSEANNYAQKDKVIDQSQADFHKELSIKSMNIPRKISNKLATESSQQFIKDDEYKILNKSANQFFSQNPVDFKTNNENYSRTSIDKINLEIKQLKNSLMSTDRLLRTTKTKNQYLSEKVNQAEQIKANLDSIPKSVNEGSNLNITNSTLQQNTSNLNIHAKNNENTQNEREINIPISQEMYKNIQDKQVKNQINQQSRNEQIKQQQQQQKQSNAYSINKNNKHLNDNQNQNQLNETSQSEIHATSNFTPRDLSQNMPTPISYQDAAYQADKSYNNEDPQIQQQLLHNEQIFTLHNQTPYDSNNELQQVQSPSTLSNSQNLIPHQSKQQYQLSQQQLNIQSQQQIHPQQSLNQQQNPQQQQSQQKLKNLLQDQFNDNTSHHHSRHLVNQSNSNSNQLLYRPIDVNHNSQFLSNNGSQNFISQEQSSQKQNIQGNRSYSHQSNYQNGYLQQQVPQQNFIQNQIQQAVLQHSSAERIPNKNFSEVPQHDQNIQRTEQSMRQQQLLQNNSPYQVNMQHRYSQPLFQNQGHLLYSPQSPNTTNSNSSQQIHKYPSTQLTQSAQNFNTCHSNYHNTLITQGHPQPIYHSPQVSQNHLNSQSNYFQPSNNNLQQSSNISQYPHQFSSYQSTHSNNQNRTSINTVSSIKGENLKLLNQQLTELELEKNLIETKILREESKKFSNSSNRSQAILDLNQKLQQVNLQIEEVRYSMMEKAL